MADRHHATGSCTRALESDTDDEQCSGGEPRHESGTTMNRFGVLLSSCAILFVPVIASAQDATLEICNNAKITVNVAYAAESGCPSPATRMADQRMVCRECRRVQSRVRRRLRRRRAIHSAVRSACCFYCSHGRRVESLSRQHCAKNRLDPVGHQVSLCVNLSESTPFTYREPAGDPAANCAGTLIPVAQDCRTGAGTFA